MNYGKQISEMAGSLKRFERPTSSDWGDVERELGCALPQEYKETVSEFGSGYFGVSFFLLNPRSLGDRRLSKAGLVSWRSSAEAMIANMEELHFYPDSGGLILLGELVTRVALFCTQEKRPRLAVCDFDFEATIPLSWGLDELIWRLYQRKCGDDYLHGIADSIWLPGYPFFQPTMSRENTTPDAESGPEELDFEGLSVQDVVRMMQKGNAEEHRRKESGEK